MVLLVKTNEQLVKEERETAIAARGAEGQTALITGILMSNLRKKWDAAVMAKREVEKQFFTNIDQAKNAYDSTKKAAIKEMGGSDIFVGITDSKCRHGKAWIRDAVFQPGQRPFALEPTPDPEMPPNLVEDTTRKFITETLSELTARASMQGIQPNVEAAINEMRAKLPDLRQKIKTELKNISWEKAREMEKEVDDKLIDGNWYQALDECVPDIILLGTGIMLGPLKRNKKVLAFENNAIVVKDQIIKEYERHSPFNVYPQADSTGPQDGHVFVKISYRKIHLQEFLGVDEYNQDEIRAVLAEADKGTLREWTLIETERAEREKKTTLGVYDTDIVDCLLYLGTLSGKLLTEAGIPGIPEDKADFDFQCSIWFIGNHVIKAMLNEDPLGRKNIYVAHFDENIDGWWGRGLPEIIVGEQQVCNACARAIVNNVGMGSGPQVEINVDRLRGGDKGDTRIIPWKRWLTTNRTMQTGPAIQFWQPAMHAQEIMNVFNDFKKGADERSSIPAYSHGDPQVGGAGNTASGLSMLISQAARGIRGIIKEVDKNLIIPSVTRTYEDIAQDPKYADIVGDIKLVAKGSVALIEKEQRTVRMLEFLNATNNDADKQLMGMDGRAYLLSEVAHAYEIDPERALPHMAEFKGQRFPTAVEEAAAKMGPESRGTPPVVGRNLAPGGMEPQGGEAQLLAGRGGPTELPRE